MSASFDPAVVAPLVRATVRQLRERKVRITVVGDIILDNAIEGEASGVHPEFKIPLLKNATTSESIGGAANIALALARLGVQATLFGCVGNDLPGRQLENLLDRHPFSSHLVRQRGWPTPRKDWIYSREGQSLRLTQRIDYDRPLPAQGREELLGEVRATCPDEMDVLILVDHEMGSIGAETTPIIELAKERGAKIVAIPRSPVLRGQPLDAIVLNEAEMRRLAGGQASDNARALAGQCAREFRLRVILTLFEEGLALFPAGPEAGEVLHFPLIELPRYEWLGVRDITTVVTALGLALNLELADLGRLATVFRHLVGSTRGNGRVFWRDVGELVGVTDPREMEIG